MRWNMLEKGKLDLETDYHIFRQDKDYFLGLTEQGPKDFFYNFFNLDEAAEAIGVKIISEIAKISPDLK